MSYDKLIPNFVGKDKASRIAHITLKERKKFGMLALPDFKSYWRTTVINTGWIGEKTDK